MKKINVKSKNFLFKNNPFKIVYRYKIFSIYGFKNFHEVKNRGLREMSPADREFKPHSPHHRKRIII